MQEEQRTAGADGRSVRQNCRPPCASRVVLRRVLTRTRCRRTSTTTGAAGYSDPKDAEATLDMSCRDAAPRARSAAKRVRATLISPQEIAATDEKHCVPTSMTYQSAAFDARHFRQVDTPARSLSTAEKNTRPSLRASVEQSTEKEFRTRGAPTAGESDARRPAAALARYRQGHNASTQLHRTGRKNLQHNGVTTDILLIRHPHARWQNERSVRGVNHILYKVFGISPRQISAGERTFDRSPE